MPFLPPNQQRQSTEGNVLILTRFTKTHKTPRTILWPLYWPNYVSWHCKVKNCRFCWSKV